jgi:predicted DNA-binding transcriptional regulator AlpA
MSFAVAAAQQVAVASKFFDVDEMSATYRVSRRTVFRLADQGILPKGIRLGGRRLWPKSVVESHLAKLANAAN